MLSVSEALDTISKNTPGPGTESHPVSINLVSRVLAADVTSPEPVPAFRASIVDGYAVKCSEGTNEEGVFPVAFAVQAESMAKDAPAQITPDNVARITTGAPLPDGADAVVMVEDTVVASTTPDGREELSIEVLTGDVKKDENVREVGSDVKAGDLIMRKGDGISAIGGEFGLLASVGLKEVQVYHKPIVGVLSTGDEIVPHDRKGGLRIGEVRDTNRPSLLTAVNAAGFEVIDLGIVSDK